MRALALDTALTEARRRIAELEAELARVRPPLLFWTQSQGRFRRVSVDALDWIEAERDYVRLHTAEGVFFHSESLGRLAARLDSRLFRRVHRSAIIRWDRAREIRRAGDGALLLVTGLGTHVRVGRTFAPGLLAALAER